MSMEDVYDCPSCGAEVHDMDVKCANCEAPLASTAALRMVGQLVMNQYEVSEVIGQGGMAVVYAARHELTRQEVALKILPPEMAAHRGLQSRFVEEARALAKLDHPNIVHLYNFGSDSGCFVLAMQLVRGKTWEKMIVERELDWRRTAEIAVGVCRALQFAHDHDIIHRDMKPSNVLIREVDGSAMVMDFGIAKAEKSSKLTDTGQTMGTVRYMSPEQVRGKDVDARSDIYSLGISLYEALCGSTPFDGETHYDIMNAQLKVVPPPLAERAPELPELLIRLVHWMLAKHPDDRPPSAGEVEKVLTSILEGESIDVPGPSPATSMPSIPPGAESPLAESPLAEAPPAEAPLGASPPTAPATAASAAASISGIEPGKKFPLTAALATAVIVGGAIAAFLFLRPAGEPEPPPRGAGGTGPGTGVKMTVPRDAAPAVDAAPVAIPEGFEVAVELTFPEDNLRILAAPGVSTEGVRATYRAGVARWRNYLKEQRPGLAGSLPPIPSVTVLLGPAKLVCDRAVLQSDDAYKECISVGTYVADERTVRIPAGSDTELALHSSIPIAHCGRSSRCADAATPYLMALFRKPQ